MTLTDRDYIAVIDFGGQYAHLIAKRIRHLGVLTRVFSPLATAQELAGAKGVILSGGPQSVYGEEAIPFNEEILATGAPLLGLCYGHQLLAHHLGGKVRHRNRGEYGRTTFRLAIGSGGSSGSASPAARHPLTEGMDPVSEVWMSHGDTVLEAPPGFDVLGETELCPVAVMSHRERPVYGIQFHPEVNDTRQGNLLLANFTALTGARKTWNMEAFVHEAVEECRLQVGERNVLMFLSGGVDSTVAFALLTRALGTGRVRGLLVDNGFLRSGEAGGILERYTKLGWDNVSFLDAQDTFLAAVADLTDPQEKRIAVGETFLHVRDDWLAGQQLDPSQWLLGQGTLYPDIIESGGSDHAEVIKFHHNRVERIDELLQAGHVVEPLKDLYKDEVRALGEALGLPGEIVWRQPFPGPGLSINVLCASGEERFPEAGSIAGDLDALLAETPYTGAVLPVRSVGVQGDSRTYTPPVAIVGPRDWALLEDTSTRITNHLLPVNRVVTLLAPETLPDLRLRPAYCTRERLDLLREADHLVTLALGEAGLMRDIFQLLVILLPLSTATAPDTATATGGGAGGEGDCLVLRPVISEDVMTARFAPLPWELLEPLCEKLMALPGICAVFHDITHKPPATFGWE